METLTSASLCVAAVHLHFVFELVLQLLQQVANEPRRLFSERLHLSGTGILVLVSEFPAEGDMSGNNDKK